jgi:hypothetical protein
MKSASSFCSFSSPVGIADLPARSRAIDDRWPAQLIDASLRAVVQLTREFIVAQG